MASKAKGRVMRANEARTGDTVMKPTLSEPRIIQRIRTANDTTSIYFTDRSEAHMSPATPVRIYRASRVVNHDSAADVPPVVFSSGGTQ